MNVKKLRIKFFFKRKNSLQFEISHRLQIFWNIFSCKKWILFNQLKIHGRKSNKGHACIYGFLKKCRKHKLSIDCQLYFFDITIFLAVQVNVYAFWLIMDMKTQGYLLFTQWHPYYWLLICYVLWGPGWLNELGSWIT